MADSPWRQRGFSLIEVVVAVAIISLGLVVILALLPNLIRQRADAAAVHVALGLAPAITSELRAHSGATSLTLVADRDGLFVREQTSAPGDQYFLIEVTPLPGNSLPPGSPARALSAKVSWPYLVATGTGAIPVPSAEQQSVSYVVSLPP